MFSKKKVIKKVYFFAQKFAYVVDFLYLCSVIGKYALFLFMFMRERLPRLLR